MAYVKNPPWVDGVAGGTLITAAALNNIETGLEATSNVADTAAAKTVPDASSTVKGVVQLAGDLAGSAAAPTVPGLTGKAATVHTHAASDVASGVMAPARLGGGTPSATTFLRGDSSWATPAGGGGGVSTPSPAIVFTGNTWMGLKTPDAIFGNNEQVVLGGTGPALKLAGMPFTLAQGFRASAMAIWVQTAVALGRIRPAIYTANPANGCPHLLVWDASYMLTDTAGVKSVTGYVDLPAGRYWTITAVSDPAIKVCTHHYNHSQPTPYLADGTAFDARGAYHSTTNHDPSNAMPPDLSTYGFGGVWASNLGPATIQAKIASFI